MTLHRAPTGITSLIGLMFVLGLSACPGQLGTDDPCKWIEPGQNHPLCPQWDTDAGMNPSPDSSQDVGSDVSVADTHTVDGLHTEDILPTVDTTHSDAIHLDGLDDVGPMEDSPEPESDALIEDTPEADSMDVGGPIDDIGIPEDVGPAVPAQKCETFSGSIQPLLDADCVVCHKGPNGSLGLFLTNSEAIDALVEKPSAYDDSLFLVVPFEPQASFFLAKLKDNPQHGTKMPLSKQPWPASVVQLVSDWIAAGATADPFNCVPVEDPASEDSP